MTKKLEAELKLAEARVKEIVEQIHESEYAEKQKRQMKLRPLAAKAHDILCPYNHTDGCGWGYENDSWEGSEHMRWLDKVEKILDTKDRFTIVKFEELEQILDLLLKAKSIHHNGIWMIDQLRRS